MTTAKEQFSGLIGVFGRALGNPAKPAVRGGSGRGMGNLGGILIVLLGLLLPFEGAQAAVAFESVATAAQSDKNINSLSIALPAGTVADNLLLATIATKKTDNSTGTSTVTAPAGWTQINQGANIDHVALATFYKIAGVAESGPYVFTVNANAEELAGAILRYSGVDTTTPVDVSGGVNGKSKLPTSPSVTTTYTDTMVVRVYGQKDNDKPATPPAGTTERVDFHVNNKVSLGVADAIQAAIGATGTGQFNTDNNKDWRAATVVLVPLQVKLAINKTTSTPSVNAGGVASYAIVVSNTGSAGATNVTIGDTLPAGFTYAATSVVSESGATRTSVINPAVGTATPGWGVWDIGVGGSVTINFTADVAAGTPGGTYDNIASASASNFGTVTDDGSATDEDVTVLDANLALLKLVNGSYYNEGDTAVYTLTASNSGPGYASNVVVIDTLPAGVSLVSAIASQGSCSGDPVVTCNLGTINSGGSATITLTATVNTGLGDGALATNSAAISADQSDPDSSNNSATADFYSCPANFIPNGASVTSSTPDPSLLDNADVICTEMLATDYGDAPGSYGDAIHYISPDLYLGSIAPDAESSSPGGGNAMGDNTDGIDDEDGAVFTTPAGGGDNIIAQVSATNGTGAAVTICGWMDIDNSGVFDASERQCSSSAAANPTVSFEWIVNSASPQNYFSRFRVCSVAAECNAPSGPTPAGNGETEDYMISYNPTAVTIGLVALDAVLVTDFLAEVGVEQLSQQQLLDLLQVWNPERADDLVGATRIETLQALRDYLDPDGDGQIAIVRWDTLAERGTIGFYVERQDADGGWQRINNDMLPGLIVAPMGGEYMIADPAARAGNVYHYRLIEQEATGRTRTYGPFQVEMP